MSVYSVGGNVGFAVGPLFVTLGQDYLPTRIGNRTRRAAAPYRERSAPRSRSAGPVWAVSFSGLPLLRAEIGDADARLGEWKQPIRRNRSPELLKHALHQTQMQRAHHALMPLGHLTERALVQAQP